MLTGAGGAAVPGLIQHLKALGHRVVAGDMRTEAAGFVHADASYVLPGGLEPNFADAVGAICHREAVDALVPLVDEELVAAVGLESPGLAVIAPRAPFVELCLDKARLMEALDERGLRVPRTRLLSDGPGDLGFPLVIKPRRGRGSRGVRFCSDRDALDRAIAAADGDSANWLVQEHIEGPEFTVSAVAWRDGELHAVVPKRIIDKRGITWQAMTLKVPAIDTLCRRIQNGLTADGPFNVQLRIDDATGEPVPFEINPRFSTTVSLTIAAGVDEVGGLLAMALGGDAPTVTASWRERLVMVRHITDLFLDEGAVAAKAPRSLGA